MVRWEIVGELLVRGHVGRWTGSARSTGAKILLSIWRQLPGHKDLYMFIKLNDNVQECRSLAAPKRLSFGPTRLQSSVLKSSG